MPMNLLNMQPKKASDMNAIPLINGVSEVADNYDAFIIDIWGVVHDGAKLYPHTKDVLKNLANMNKKCLFLSNTAYTPDEMEKSLISMGVNILKENILTAGSSTHRSVQKFKGKKYFEMATHTYGGVIDGIELQQVNKPEDADFILNLVGKGIAGEDGYYYEQMKIALKNDISMICGNPDFEVSLSGHMFACAGLYAQWYEDQGGHVEWHGKPYLPIYEWAWDKLGKIDKSRICAIGDSLRTDITGARNFGIDALWNLDGTTRDLSLEEATKRAKEKDLEPIGILRGFHWD